MITVGLMVRNNIGNSGLCETGDQDRFKKTCIRGHQASTLQMNNRVKTVFVIKEKNIQQIKFIRGNIVVLIR